MVTVDFTESQRLALQGAIDSTRSQAERNKLGQFATPTLLAADILDHAKSLIARTQQIRFLDPAFGTGSFYSALLRSFPSKRIASATGYEIDAGYGSEARRLWADTALDVVIGDFTLAEAPGCDDAKASLIVCNPPYVRHHHLVRGDKERLQKRVRDRSGISLSGLAGLYCYFIFLSHEWMARDALAVWLIPSEFMDVNYGAAVREYLLSRVTLLRIHRFDPGDVQFDDALVSSAIVVFRNAPAPDDYEVDFSYGGTLTNPKNRRGIPARVLAETGKWSRYPLAPVESASERGQVKLSDVFNIKRGLATGANGFFILTADEACMHEIPPQFLVPILPSPRHLQTDEIMSDPSGNPDIERPLLLVSCDLPEEDVRTRYPALWTYFETAVERGIDKGYLCKHRLPWYAQEVRPPSPLLCTYMGRSSARSDSPFRFILNHSRATAANVYLMMYPKPALDAALRRQPHLLTEIWLALREIPVRTLVDEGRVYGGGLHKMEPKELGNTAAGAIAAMVPALKGRGLILR